MKDIWITLLAVAVPILIGTLSDKRKKAAIRRAQSQHENESDIDETLEPELEYSTEIPNQAHEISIPILTTTVQDFIPIERLALDSLSSINDTLQNRSNIADVKAESVVLTKGKTNSSKRMKFDLRQAIINKELLEHKYF